MSDTYPRQAARTWNQLNWPPRAFRIADDGSRVAFLRTRAGDDTLAGLWVLDVASGEERGVPPGRRRWARDTGGASTDASEPASRSPA